MSDAVRTDRLGAPARWAFIVFMLALTALFVVLGMWQVNRLAEKQALVRTVEQRADLDPVALPGVSEWPAIDPGEFDFRPVSVTGTFVPGETVQVFTSLSDARGAYGGTGFWIMTPLVLEDRSGLVWINRGFVPQDTAVNYSAANFRSGEAAPEGVQTVTGLARKPEAANAFTPAADPAQGIDWIRDPQRLDQFLGSDLAGLPAAPVTVDRFAGEEGELPQAGETVMTFSNRHLEYAGTWFAFALITPLMLGFWYWRQRKS